MGLFSNNKLQLFGIDVSSSAVKVVQLSKSGDRYKVEYYGVDALPANAVVEKNITEVDRVSAAISNAVKRAGIKRKNAAIAVSGSAVITKTINMPTDLSEDELEEQLSLDANQYIPYPIEEVSLDFNVLGPVENNPELSHVLIACSRSENVDVCVEAIEGAGLVASIIDVESFAIEATYQEMKNGLDLSDDEIVALFDIGATTTTLHVMYQGRSIYTRDQTFGGKQLTDEIMQRYGLSMAEAGLAKRQGGLPESYETEVLQSFNDSLIQQLSRALQFFFSATEFNNVDKIVLAGGTASIEGLGELTEEQVGVPVQIANPIDGFAMASRIDDIAIKTDSPALMTVIGLAMRTFD
ncbi:MAG: pilus assembly protein PilM [Proteobacteria bacterium]|nr:pilus assembly protein PilM [Pseudomonadota bacterium]